MNVTGVSSAPVPAPVPPVTPPARSSETSADADRASRTEAAKAAERAAAEQRKAEAVKLPPLKPLSTTEIRVILGALPPNHAAVLRTNGDAGVKGGSFDAYA